MSPKPVLLLPLAGVAAAAALGAPNRRTEAKPPDPPKPYLALGHSLAISRAAWSPDGRALATGSDDNTIIIWARATRLPRLTLSGDTSRIRSLAWSPDGKSLLSTDDYAVALLWDATTGKQRATLAASAETHTIVSRVPNSPLLGLTLAGVTEPTQRLVWSPNGKLIAGTAGPVRIWDARSGQQRVILESGGDCGPQWSPDGRLLAMGSGASGVAVSLWDVAAGRFLPGLPGGEGYIQELAWSPNGQWLAGTDDARAVYLWESATGKLRVLLPRANSESGGGNLLAWSPDGKTLATSGVDRSDQTLLWDAASGARTATLESPECGIASLEWSPKGSTLAASGSGIILWNTKTRTRLATLTKTPGPVMWSPDGQLFISGEIGPSLTIRDGRSGRVVATMASRVTPVSHLAWSPDGRAIAAASEEPAPLPHFTNESQGFVRIWDTRTGHPRSTLTDLSGTAVRKTLPGYPDRIYDLAWSPDGKTIATTTDQYGAEWGVVGAGGIPTAWYRACTLLWDAAAGTVRAPLPGAAVKAVWNPDGSVLATGAPRSGVILWDAGGRRLRVLPTQLQAWQIDWSPDGKSLAASDYSGRQFVWTIWNAATGEKRAAVPSSGYPYPAMAWSPSGALLATTTYDRSVSIWNTNSGKPDRTLTLRTAPVAAPGLTAPAAVIAWRPDGKLLATGSPDLPWIKLWNPATGDLRGILHCPGHGVGQVKWSPDGKLLAGIGEDHAMILWDVARRKLRAVLSGHTGPITDFAWSPNGPTLATSSEDGSLRLWDAATGKEQIALYSLDGGTQWLAITPEGYYAASAHAADVIQWQQGERQWPAAKFCRRYARPDLVRQALSASIAAKPEH